MGSATPDAASLKRNALRKSALDYITGSATTPQTRLSKSDGQRLGSFLTSVRDLETQVIASNMPAQTAAGCVAGTRPTQVAIDNQPYAMGFDRGQHATLMIDLAVMAFQCDLTRVISFMLDDARSDFVYNFITQRKFTQTGSTPGTGAVQGYHGLQHAGDQNDGFATITWWNMDRLNEMITKISAIKEGAGTAFDSTVIHAMSGMHGGNHDGLNLPVVLAGTGGGILKTGQALNLNGGSTVTGDKSVSGKNLQDVHATILNKVFGGPATFGTPVGAYTAGQLPRAPGVAQRRLHLWPPRPGASPGLGPRFRFSKQTRQVSLVQRRLLVIAASFFAAMGGCTTSDDIRVLPDAGTSQGTAGRCGPRRLRGACRLRIRGRRRRRARPERAAPRRWRGTAGSGEGAGTSGSAGTSRDRRAARLGRGDAAGRPGSAADERGRRRDDGRRGNRRHERHARR